MKKIIIVLLLLFAGFLFANEAMMRLELLVNGYLPEYKSFKFNEPIWAFEGNADIINLAENFGVGGGVNISFKSYHRYINDKKHYDLYFHNFWNTYKKDNYFIYGFYFGARQNDITFRDPGEYHQIRTQFYRFLIGFEFANENWGFEIKATQSEAKKMIFVAETKFRYDNRLIFRTGSSTRGPISGIKSEMYFMIGYEFFLGK